MKKIGLVCILFAFSTAAIARDDVGDYPIKDALSESSLGEDISFYFGGQKVPAIAKKHGEFRTNKKTNAFNKTDLEACNWVFLSAMITLRDRAIAEGGNAVINIRSNYKNKTTSSETDFKCGAGKFLAGAALIGTVVTLK